MATVFQSAEWLLHETADWNALGNTEMKILKSKSVYSLNQRDQYKFPAPMHCSQDGLRIYHGNHNSHEYGSSDKCSVPK